MSGLIVAFQCLVYLVCIVQRNQTDRLALYNHGDYLPSGSPSNSPKLGTPSSEGIGIDLYSVYLIPSPPGEGEGTKGLKPG